MVTQRNAADPESPITRSNPITTPRQQPHPERAERTRQAAFVAKKSEINEKLSRLQALSNDHFNAESNAID